MTDGIAAGAAAAPDPGEQDDDGLQIGVSMWTAGRACEVLKLVSELFAADPAVSAAACRFLHRKGADPEPAAAWLAGAAGALAEELDAALAYAGVAVDRELARYWRRQPVVKRNEAKRNETDLRRIP